MYMKIAVAASIFVLLFVSAWYINEQIKRDYYTTEIDEIDGFEIQSNFSPYMDSDKNGIFPSFMSREYIRVDRRTN